MGILAADYFKVDTTFSAATGLLVAVAAVLTRRYLIGTGLIIFAFFWAGATVASVGKSSVRDDQLKRFYDSGFIQSGTPIEFEGVLAAGTEVAPDGAFLFLEVERLWRGRHEIPVSGLVRVFVPETVFAGPVMDLKYGSRLRIACPLQREEKYLNPGVRSRLQQLDQLGVDATCSVKSRWLVEHLADESVVLPLAWIYDHRSRMVDVIRANLSPRPAGVMIASLLGNKNFLDKGTADLFRDGGTFHILIISGLHITFIGAVLIWIMRFLSRSRWVHIVLAGLVLWAYTIMVGADIPVLRAAIMFSVFLVGYATYWPHNLLNSLGFCWLALLTWRPSDLFNPSFQLTFLAVGAIVGCGFPLMTKLREIGEWTPTSEAPFPPNVPLWLRRAAETIYWDAERWKIAAASNVWSGGIEKRPYLSNTISSSLRYFSRYLIEALLVSLVVQIWMLPLSVIYFNRVSVAAVVLNLWVGVFIAVESFSVAIGIGAQYFSSLLAAGFFGIAEASNWAMLLLPGLIVEGGWASFRVPTYPFPISLIYPLFFVPIFFLAWSVIRWEPFALNADNAVSRRIRHLTAMGAAASLASVMVFHPFSAPASNGALKIDFLDVGQGDSSFITFPSGQTMLVDGGGRFDYRSSDPDRHAESDFEPDVAGIGETVVSRFLWAQGRSSIDHLVVTHGDADHIQGLRDIVKNFKVGSLIVSRLPAGDPELLSLMTEVERRRIPVEIVSRGDVLEIGGAFVEVLHPSGGTIRSPSTNNDSTVLTIRFGERSFLLTGDIEEAAESQLLSSGTLRSDVIKIPHHGSRTSSTAAFVEAVRPRFAIVSAGRRSQFGHPHPEVVGRWQISGAVVLSTPEKGAISIETNGKTLSVATVLP